MILMQKEIEVRFFDVDKEQLVKKLHEVGAEDKGEDFLSEIIFYDQDGEWSDAGRYVRLRTRKGKTIMTYKHITHDAVDGANEVEFEVPDATIAEHFLTAVGLVAARYQEKRRHTFTLDGVTIDIDTWPRIPNYVELEGASEGELRKIAAKIGFDWNDAVFIDARKIIENVYHIPVGTMKWFTFDRFE